MTQNELKKNFPAAIFTLILLFFGGWYFFAETLDVYPAYVHAWTQSDRLALAMNFQNNGFDFLHPATFNLLTKDGITQVDFPIHDYLSACISSFLKVDVIRVFRSYNMIYSLIGMFFFFRLALIVLKSSKSAIYATFFIFTLPFYVYYQNGFLPSAPSFANFLIGLFFLVRARQNQSHKAYLLGVFFFTLAALARSPFFIFLFALILQQVWQQWKQRKFQFYKMVYPLLAVLLFWMYWLYNQHLAETYGSMFLFSWLSFDSVSNFIEVVQTALDRWGNELLSPFHAILLLILLIAGIKQFLKKGLASKTLSSLTHYFLLSAIGVLLYFFAFGKQFADHDYYYIDTFLPLLSILILLLFARLEIPKRWYTSIATFCTIFFVYFFSYAKEIQEKRYTPPFNDRIAYAQNVYEQSKKDLKMWGIQASDTLYVLEANSTNMPFTFWGNKGYTSLNSSKALVQKELNGTFNYAVLVDSFFVSSAYKDYPEIIYELDRINGNGNLSVYRKSNNKKDVSFFEHLIFYGHSNFDDNDQLADSITAWTAEEVLTDSMGKSLRIKPNNLYTLSVKKKLGQLIPEKPIRVHILADYYQSDSSKVQIVSSLNDYYQTFYTVSHFKKIKEWMSHQFNFKISPSHFIENDELLVYFYNPDQGELYVDNVKILIYQ